MSKINKELKGLSAQALHTKADEYRRDLFTLRLNSISAHVKDYSQFKKLRKNVARALTYLKQAETK